MGHRLDIPVLVAQDFVTVAVAQDFVGTLVARLNG